MGDPLRYEVNRSGFLEWDVASGMGGDGLIALALVPVLFLGSFLTHLGWRAVGKGWVISGYNERDRRVFKQRCRTRQQAQEELEAIGGS